MFSRLKGLRSASNTLATSLACLLTSASVAFAGFDWTPPPQPQMDVQSSSTEAPTSLTNASVVTGAADHLPLSVVLHQIIPADFTFMTAPDVDLSTKVSWSGGRPWPDVLQDALSPVGYSAAINGTVVTIAKAGLPASVVETTIEPPPPPPPLPAVDQPMSWDAARGTTLRTLLEHWSDRAQVELYYSSEYDYPLDASIHLEGTYEQAVRTLLDGFAHATPQPIGKLHRNSAAGHAVLVVETRGNAYGE